MINEEGLRDWFGKSKSKDGKSGWVNVVTGGTCASDKPGEGTPKCVSSSKRASMTPAERKSAQRRKKAADPNQQSKSGAAKPTYVSTDPKKKMKESIDNLSEVVGGAGTLVRQGVKLGGKKGGRAVQQGTTAATSQGKKMATQAKQGNQSKLVGDGKSEKRGAAIGGTLGAIGGALIPDGPAMVAGEIGGGIVGSKLGGKIGRQFDKRAQAKTQNEETDKKGSGSGKKDACYKKVKTSASVWPSAYASGRLVQCRKKGAANYGKSKNEEFMALPEMTDIQINSMRRAGIEVEVLDEKCWDGYTQKGMKKKGKKVVPNCVPVGEELGNGIGGGITGAVLSTVGKGLNLAKTGIQTAIRKPVRTTASLGTQQLARMGGSTRKTDGFIGPPAPRPVQEDTEAVNELEKRLLELNDVSYDSIDKLMRGICEDNDMTPRELHDEFKEKHEQTPDSWVRSQKELDEAVRIPTKTGNIYLVGFSWKGRYMMMKVFFPTIQRPSKQQVQDALNKIYPGALVSRYDMAMQQPGDTLLHVEEHDKSSKSCSKGEYYCNDSKKCKSIPKGYHVMPNGDLMKDEDHDEGEGGDVSEGASWTKKEGQNKSGGLNEKGRKSYEKENPGSDLKAPSKKVGNKRRSSFCARMKGMRKRQKPSNNTGEDRLSKSLRAWNC